MSKLELIPKALQDTILKNSEDNTANVRNLSTPERWVAHWLEENKYTFNIAGEIVQRPGELLTANISRCYHDSYNLYAEMKLNNVKELSCISKLTNIDVKSGYSMMRTKEMDKAKRELIKSFNYTKDNDLVASFITALAGEDELDLNVAVFKHWLWQVKRKMHGKVGADAIMPVLFGKQGCGKSRALVELMKPFDRLTMNSTLDQITNPTVQQNLVNRYVCVLDECQGTRRTDVDALKHVITADVMSLRPLYSNTIQDVKQNCSFIGTSNKEISELVFDSTGMRRFFQLNCLDVADWDVINGIDYVEMWQGIDEHKEDGYINPIREKLQKVQKEATYTTPVQCWVVDSDIETESNHTTNPPCIFTPSRHLYNKYAHWCEESGYKAKNINSWGQEFSRVCGHKSFKKKYDDKVTAGYNVVIK